MKKKLITAVLGGTAVASLAFASASALTVNGGVLQVGDDTDLTCDPDGVKVNWGLETDDNLVYSAQITDISDACAGADVVLKTNLHAVDEKEVATADASGSVRVHFDTPLDAQALETVRVWIGK